jgi:hypothetical protein
MLDSKPVEITPEPHKGRMLVDVPAGQHELHLYISVSEALPAYYRFVWLASLIAAITVMFGFYNQSFRRKVPA